MMLPPGLRLFSRLVAVRHYSSHSLLKVDLKSTRNVGIIAHIDAGKTTTTERFLFYSGFVNTMGEVHDGDTVMDYMVQERERGITITSAAISFAWKNNRINLIDTPGHVDFTIEVERSLSVLDGAVAILDASAGVEAQTMTVWSQADRYQVPRIIYLNKMDKPLANVPFCLQSIQRKLNIQPLLVHLPLKSDKKFYGVVDVTSMQKFTWTDSTIDDGISYVVAPLGSNEPELLEKASQTREELILALTELDEQFADTIIGSDKLEDVTVQQINNCLRRTTLKQLAYPVLCGSSYKNIGVQLLLDAVIKYLPSPIEKVREIANYYGNDLCAFAFKTIHHKRLGVLTFLRIYSGEIKQQQNILNLTRGGSEKINKLYMTFADNLEEVATISYGNIAAVTGLKNTITGDTLVQSKNVADRAIATFAKKNSIPLTEAKPILAGINIPDPVFYCSIEAQSISKQKELDLALENLQREDPTFRVSIDQDSGQTIIKGMGELHIEVIKDRIEKEYKIEAYLGPLQISYKEAILNCSEETLVFDKTIAGSKNFVKITLRVKPGERSQTKRLVKVIATSDNDLTHLRSDYLKAVEAGVVLAMSNGPILSFPVIDVAVDLLWLEVSKGTSHTIISAASSQCFSNAIKNSLPVLLEPHMKLEISTSQSYVGTVLNDLSLRRSQICQILSRGDVRVVNAITPLAELVNYSTNLRTLTSGNAYFTMEFDSYKIMSESEQKKAIQQVTGI